MVILIDLLTIVFIAVCIVIGVVFVIAKVISGISFNPLSAAWKRMLEKLRARLQRQIAGNRLVAWDHEMLGLLSLNRSVLKKPGFFDPTAEGVFTTIFHEPVLAYASQKSGADSVTVARTSDREFIYRQKGRETEIWLNGQPFGVFVDGALLAAGRGSRLLAQLDLSASAEAQLPVLIGNATAGAISNPSRSTSPNPRALTLLRELGPEEENALLALTILQMTR